MFLPKTNSFLKSKIVTGYIDNYSRNSKRGKECLYVLKTCSYSVYANTNANQLCFPLCHNKNEFNKRDAFNNEIKGSLTQWLNFNRKLCTRNLPKDANTFGDLTYKKYEFVEMDEAEKEEERFTENDAKIPKWQKLSPGRYAQLIKSHLEKKDLKLALSVLDLVKQNRDKPTVYMYSLLIRAFAVQGDVKRCFKLYNKMRKFRLVPNAAIYNSLINACAISKDTNTALEYLQSLREYFYRNNYALNETHYITLVKAYSWHKQITSAFEIADEVMDKRLITKDIYAVLFHAAISDEENGLKYALILWHKMRRYKITPTITHYNLLLRAIRDTRFGNMKINDILISQSLNTQIQLDKIETSDLLNFPPRLNTSFLASKKCLQSKSTDIVLSDDNTEQEALNDEILPESLNNVLKENPLVLFGGLETLLKRMKDDNVTPDIKTLTMLMELLPNTIAAENSFLRYVEKSNFKLDIDFFNMLIKKRGLRKQYKQAKDILYEVQRRHLTPDILTFGTLAIGCTEYNDGVELLEQMNNIRFHPNNTVLETLVKNATSCHNFKYVSYLMDYILKHEIKPSAAILNFLEEYQTSMLKAIKGKHRYNRKEVRKIEKDYNNFIMIYDEWKAIIQKEDIVKSSRPSTS